MKGYETCYGYRPDLADERRRNASRGGKRGGRGRSGASPEMAEIKSLLKNLTDRVIFTEGTEYLPANHAAVAAQLINARLRAVEVERKIRETEDLASRIEALERTRQTTKGGRAWRGA
ncbi:MAG: hypothetical protein ACR2GU_14310 [Rubrobacteraceae bacterium]